MFSRKPRPASVGQQLAAAAKVSQNWDAWNAANAAKARTGATTNQVWQQRVGSKSVAPTGADGDFHLMLGAKNEIMEHVVAAYELIMQSGACNVDDYDAEGCSIFASSLSAKEYSACVKVHSTLKRIIENNLAAGRYRVALMESDMGTGTSARRRSY